MKKTLFSSVLFFVLTVFFMTSAQANPGPINLSPPWKQAVEKIERAKVDGDITVDEAAIFRFWAVSNLERLPEEFQPATSPAEYEAAIKEEYYRSGLSELADRLDALFIDEEQWSEDTKSFIMDQLKENPEENSALDKEYLTDHFIIHWTDKGPDAPAAGLLYIEGIADGLEHAWSKLESPNFGYEMPDPVEFGLSPHPDDDITRFDVYVKEEIKACNIKTIHRGGFVLPGKIKLKNNISLDKLDTLTAHEWFHMMQWNYAGFKNSKCPGGAINAWLYYSSKGAWLMESTAMWIEDEIYPNENDYLESVPDYTGEPELSLFKRNGYHEYGAVVFIKFLQEHLAGPAGYAKHRDIVREIWERVPLENNSPIHAVTYVLMHPPSGAEPYSNFDDTWTSIFDDFAIANLFKDYGDGALWDQDTDVDIVDTKKPIADPEYPVSGNQSGFSWPAAQYIEVYPDDLNLPDGSDSTGATVHLDFFTSCLKCTLDVFEFTALGDKNRTTYEFDDYFDSLGPGAKVVGDLSSDFGAPGGTEKLTLVFVNPVPDFGPQGYYKYTFTAKDNPPKAPRNLSASENANNVAIELDWDAVDEEGISYRIYRNTNSSVPTTDEYLIDTSQSSKFTDSDVERGVRYYYLVTSLDRGQNESEASNQASAVLPTVTPTPPPSGTTVVISISHGRDDAGPNPDQGCSYSTSWNEIYFGECFDGTDVVSGFRFDNVPVPQGAVIQEAYLNFTVNGPYSNSLSLRIKGENTGDAASFDFSRRPDALTYTSADVSWSIPASDAWGLNNERRTPDISPVVQEIISRADWASGNGMAIIVEDNGDEGGLHRRVIGYERPTSTYSGHLAELVIIYGDGSGPTPTPTPVVEPTPVPSPESTPSPCTCAILCAMGSQSTNGQTSNPGAESHGVGFLASFVQQTTELWDGVELLQDLRDQILVHSPGGRRYIDLYKENSPEIASLLIENPELRAEGFTAIDLFRPGFQALLEGRGDEVFVTSNQVQAVEKFLDHLSAVASPELRQTIVEEREDKPLEQLTGESMAGAQATLLENNFPEADAGFGYRVEEGGSIELHGVATDPDDDPLTFEWDMNDDGRYEKRGQSVFFYAVDLDGPSLISVRLRVCDDEAGCVVEKTTVQILNSAPIVGAGEAQHGKEGSPLTFEGVFYDPGGKDSHVIGWDFNEDGTYDDIYNATSNYPTSTHVWGDDYHGFVTLRVVDDDGLYGKGSARATVKNVGPSVSEISVEGPAHPDELIWAGDELRFGSTFTDPGWLDTHQAEWQYVSGEAFEDAQLTEENEQPNATGDVSGTHVYFESGSYQVTLRVTDDDGGIGETTKEITIVPIPAEIQCDPDVINQRTKGEWMTCYIQLPSDYDVYEIDGSTVKLNGIPAYLGKQGWAKAEGNDGNIADYDKDGELERMVKFDLKEVQDVLSEGEEVDLIIQGAVFYQSDLADFSGEDKIRVISKGP